jgi:succinate-semialdehyde dehydrogenase/glutarate-semialdehyde dehydrogenase
VAGIAGDELKHTVLELGGSDPFVVMPSADLAQAAKVARSPAARTTARAASPPSASSSTRTSRRVRAAVRRRAAGAGRRRPDRRGHRRRPAGHRERRDGVAELVDEAVGKGARLVLGGAAPGGPGFFYPPTLLTGVTKDMGLYYEEVFGRSPSCTGRRTSTRRSSSRTTRRSASAATPGRTTRTSRSASRASSTRAWCSSTG